MTNGEFLKWCAFLEWDVNAFHREDHYLAQIAAEFRRANVKDPRKVRITDLILSFKAKEKTVAKKISVKMLAAQERSFWFQAVGLEPEKK